MNESDRILTLLQHEDPNQRNAALDSLPATLSEPVTLALINLLRDDNLSLRQRAMEALINQGSGSLEPLIEALRINDYNIQFNIIRILGAIGDQRATAHLVEIGEHAPDSLHYEIIEALTHVKDPQTIQSLITALGHKEHSIRDLAARGIIKLGTAALPSLFNALKSEQWLIRSYAARILGQIRDPQALEPLVAALQHSDSGFRKEVIKAIGLLGDRRAVPALLDELAKGEPETTRMLIESLGALKDLRAVPLMIEALKVEDWSQHKYIIDNVVGLGTEAIEHVCQFLDNSSPRIRIGVAKILGQHTHQDAVGPLIRLSRDADKEIRKITVTALGKHLNNNSIHRLVHMLGDPINEISSQAGRSLLQLAPHSRSLLIEALCHDNTAVRRRAALLLCRKDLHEGAATPFRIPVHAVPFLMDSLQEERQYTKYLTHLLRQIKGQTMAQIIGMIYQGHAHIDRLIEELRNRKSWQHLSLLSEDLEPLTSRLDKREAKSVLQSLKEAAKDQRKEVKDGYCLQHYARFDNTRSSGIEYLGCRKCKSTIFGVQAPVVYLIIDRTMKTKMERFPDRIHLNHLALKQTVDFDHVHIGPCDSEDIRSLCIEIGNDTDPVRRKAYAKANCSIDAATSLNKDIYNLLSTHFRSVHYVE